VGHDVPAHAPLLPALPVTSAVYKLIRPHNAVSGASILESTMENRKMKFRIHGIYADGTTDTWLVEGETIEEVRAQAMEIVNSRNLADYWSEEA